ncbi:unnamed protein product [Allacma fusca]|uniref:Glucose-methanol-choline oxidoreductase N-terminal domain-containing protein n=1 Tax=Allacma fusca TaxID=39272 RepID=A0A8J2KMJ9_9HEXA|nr:unnamed protein product [Allacma fusca]
MHLLLPRGQGEFMTLLKYSILVLIPELVQKQFNDFARVDYFNNAPQVHDSFNQTFDFIVVGAGGDPTWISKLPGTDLFAANNPGSDWLYQSVPQKDYCLSCLNHQLPSWRGLGLGGTSNINFLMYNRGNPYGFDQWSVLSGDKSWEYKRVLNYFKKSENYMGNYPNGKVHGCGGELFVEGNYNLPGTRYFFRAVRENGFVEQDINANQTNAFMRMDQTSINGVRWSSYHAFLRPALFRRNLHVRRYAFVTRILFEKSQSTKAVGVEYIWHGVRKFAFASREIILSAGSYNTPKILLLSGVGPKKDLKKLGLPIVKDLPVGKNLQDHPTTLFPVIFNKSYTSIVFERDVLVDTIFDALYPSRHGKGPLVANNLLSTGYISTKLNNDIHWPNIQAIIMYLGISHATASVFLKLLNIYDKKLESLLEPFKGLDGNLVTVSLVRPYSFGSVTLNGTNPFNPPLINPSLFSDRKGLDMKNLVLGMKRMVEFYEKSPTYQTIGAQLIPFPWPGCENLEFKSLKYYQCYIRHFTFTLWHPAGTCRMGRRNDPTAVVDSRLRVLGLQNIRIADASVMTRITNGNTHAPVVMIAEKASDMIKQDWGEQLWPPGSQQPCRY